MKNQPQATQAEHCFAPDVRLGVYKTIFGRRDVRGQFKPDPVPDAVLSRILMAAHHAPSVGFMQPWNFVIVTDDRVKKQVHGAFEAANGEAAELFEGERRQTYKSLKLEGILEAPLNICVTCDRSRTGPVVIGRTAVKSMDLFSSVCAVQNLWLAARAEGLGMGWVSIIHQRALQEALGIPEKIVPIAYLCIGYVEHFLAKPELESAGWLKRLPLDELVYFDRWENTEGNGSEPLLNRIREDMELGKQGEFVRTRVGESQDQA